MSRTLHWALLVGCGALTGLFAEPAWRAVRLCELPSDCRSQGAGLEAFLGGRAPVQAERLGSLEEEGEDAPISTELVADRS